MGVFFLFCVAVLLAPIFCPSIDLIGWFYRAGQGFWLADNPVCVALHGIAYDGARVLAIAFAVGVVWGGCCKVYAMAQPLPPFACGSTPLPRVKHGAGSNPPLKGEGTAGVLSAKCFLFLLLALLVGPGLVANVGLKDHWGRARPREVVEFGGAAAFTPFYEPHLERARSNGSFVSGDGAFGFFLPAFAYVAPRRFSRRVLWGSLAAGCVFGFIRIAMGAHFFSDVVYAGLVMTVTNAAMYAAMFGRREMVARWRGWLEK